MFAIVVRYAAMAVLVADGEVGVALATSAGSMAVKGSLASLLGEVRGGVGRVVEGIME